MARPDSRKSTNQAPAFLPALPLELTPSLERGGRVPSTRPGIWHNYDWNVAPERAEPLESALCPSNEQVLRLLRLGTPKAWDTIMVISLVTASCVTNRVVVRTGVLAPTQHSLLRVALAKHSQLRFRPSLPSFLHLSSLSSLLASASRRQAWPRRRCLHPSRYRLPVENQSCWGLAVRNRTGIHEF